jgi:hypothetical protein
MVEYALAGEGAGVLIDRDSYRNRHWPADGALDEVYKRCGCTMITKCPEHDDYSTWKFLLSDPLSNRSEIWSYKQEQQSKRSKTIGDYILFHELLDRYPHYQLHGSARTGDTFYRQKAARFNYVPPYRVCANELFHKQKQWLLKGSMDDSMLRPLSAPTNLTPRSESKKTTKNKRNVLPPIVPRIKSSEDESATRTYHRNNYFYDMAL